MILTFHRGSLPVDEIQLVENLRNDANTPELIWFMENHTSLDRLMPDIILASSVVSLLRKIDD